MRKTAIILLLLILLSCTAFAESEDENADPEAQTAIDIDLIEMTLSDTVFYKTGAPIEPLPDLLYEGEPLSEDTYDLQYSNNINVGTATVTAVFENGTKSVSFEIVPAKPDDPAITKVESKKPKVIVSWQKVSCIGYELQVSRKSSFADAQKFRLTGNRKSIGKLLNGKTYHFRVRAYNTEKGKTTRSAWSTCSCKVHTTGAVGRKYSLNGAYVKSRTVKSGNNYYYYNKSGLRSGCSKTMWKKVKNASSGTRYLIAVDCTKNRLCIYKGRSGKWSLKYYWKCSTGKPSTPTIKGTFGVSGKVPHFGEERDFTVWYASRIKYEYYIHSVIYKTHSKTEFKDRRLGKNLSHGCVRVSLKHAKWIYNNCSGGTRIIIY